MRAAVTDTTGQVVNVIIVNDTTFDPGPDLTLAVLPDGSTVGPGWRLVAGAWAEPPRRDLAANRDSIPGDGTTAATVTYTDTHDDAPTSVVFTVNGATKTVQLTAAGNAILDVVSSTPGDTVVVTVDALPDAAVTITVEGATP